MKDHLLESQTLDWLLDAAAEPIAILDGQGAILMANGALAALFGHARNALAGRPVDGLLAGFPTAAGVDGNRPSGLHELTGQRHDGSTFPAEVVVSPLTTPWGLPLTMATVRDITPRRQAEQALRDNEARLRAIVDTAVDGIITIDETGRIERINPAALRIFGYTEAETVGRNVGILMPDPDRSRHDGYLQDYLRTGERRIIGLGREVTGRRKDGSCFPMDLAVAEMQVGGRRMFTGMVRDITERKRAEAQYARLLQEVTSANEELTNFAYVVSHDLKAPLRGIGSLASWLSEDYGDKLDAEGQEHLRLLVSRVHRMGALIDGILEYSRIGRMQEARAPVDLDALVRETIDLLDPPAHIEVRIDDPLPRVLADRTRIQQVFQNLVSNAIKYMDKPRGLVRIGCEPAGERWRFSVSDNGPGIEARHHERIFQLFQTLAPRDRIESTGVGLALVKKILDMHGSGVSVQSTVGAGSTFIFTLPAAGMPHASQERTSP